MKEDFDSLWHKLSGKVMSGMKELLERLSKLLAQNNRQSNNSLQVSRGSESRTLKDKSTVPMIK